MTVIHVFLACMNGPFMLMVNAQMAMTICLPAKMRFLLDNSPSFNSYGQPDKLYKTLYRRKSDGWVTARPYRIDPEKWEAFENPDYDPEYGEPNEAIRALEQAVDQASMKEIFGDHVSVVVTKDKVEVEEYSHE